MAEQKPVAATAVTATAAKFDPSKVKVTKNITLPQLKIRDGVAVYFKSAGKIHKGKSNIEAAQKADAPAKDKKVQMEVPNLMNIVNLETGEEMQIICGAVLKNELIENYPNDSYVGKSFRVEQMKVEGKRYKNYKIAEIEV